MERIFMEICEKIAKLLLETIYEKTALEILKLIIEKTKLANSKSVSTSIIVHLLENNASKAFEEYKEMREIIASDPYNWALVSGLLMLHGADTRDDFYNARNALLYSRPDYQIILKCLKEGQCEIENCAKIWDYYLSECDKTDHIGCSMLVLIATVTEENCSKLLHAVKSRDTFIEYTGETPNMNHAHSLLKGTQEDLDLIIMLESFALVEVIRLLAEGHLDKAKIIAENRQSIDIQHEKLWAQLTHALSKEDANGRIKDVRQILAKLALISLR